MELKQSIQYLNFCNNCFNKTLPQCNTKVIFQSKNRFSNLFRFKDSIPKELRSHIVYKFLCINCNMTYYGETAPHLNVRYGEHLSLSALTGKRVNNNKKSAVKDYCLFFNHVGSFEDFSILTYESNPFKLLIKEALLVSREKPLLNKQVKSIPLHSSFCSLKLLVMILFKGYLKVLVVINYLKL